MEGLSIDQPKAIRPVPQTTKKTSAGMEHLLPWSDFIKEQCTGLIDVENVTVENHPQLPFQHIIKTQGDG